MLIIFLSLKECYIGQLLHSQLKSNIFIRSEEKRFVGEKWQNIG